MCILIYLQIYYVDEFDLRKWYYYSFVDGGWGSVQIGAEETHNPNLTVYRGPPALSALSGEPR